MHWKTTYPYKSRESCTTQKTNAAEEHVIHKHQPQQFSTWNIYFSTLTKRFLHAILYNKALSHTTSSKFTCSIWQPKYLIICLSGIIELVHRGGCYDAFFSSSKSWLPWCNIFSSACVYCICSYLAFWSTRFSFFFPWLTWDRVANWHRLSPNDCSAQGKGNSFLPTCWIVGVYNQHFSAFYDDALPLLMLNFLLDAISGIQKSSTAVCVHF